MKVDGEVYGSPSNNIYFSGNKFKNQGNLYCSARAKNNIDKGGKLYEFNC